MKKFWPLFWIILLAAALRIYGLADESLWLDEAATVDRIQGSYQNIFLDWNEGAFYNFFTKIWCDFFGTTEFSIRFISVLFGICCIPMIYFLGAKLFDSTVGFYSALFLAVNPFAIYYSQEARPYTMFLLGAIGSFYFVACLAKEWKSKFAFGYAFFSVIAVYAHPFAVFLFPIHLFGFFILSDKPNEHFKKNFRNLFWLFTITFMVSLPQAYLYASAFYHKSHTGHVASWIPVPTHAHLLGTLIRYFMEPILAVPVYLLIGIIIVLKFKPALRRSPSFWFLSSILSGFIFVPLLISWIVTPIFVIRYTIPALAALILALAWSICELPARVRTLSIVVLLLLTSIPLYHYYSKTDKDDWRAVAKILSEKVRAGDAVVIYPNFMHFPLEYYYKPPQGIDMEAPIKYDNLAEGLSEAKRIWFIRVNTSPTEETNKIQEELTKNRIIKPEILVKNKSEENPWAFNISNIYIDEYEKP